MRRTARQTHPDQLSKQVAKAAKQGHAEAQHHLGVMHLNGEGGAKSNEIAFKWIQLAAKQGYAKAQHHLGVMHLNGEGGAKSNEIAFHWIQLAAKQGYAEAQHHLGLMHLNGTGVAKNDEMAFDWIRLAAAQRLAEAFGWLKNAADDENHQDAQYHLGVMYQQGEGDIAQDASAAAKWFTKAAEQGHTKAQYHLGLMHLNGIGVVKSDEKAVNWFEKAAAQKHAYAQYHLGFMSHVSRAIKKNTHITALNLFMTLCQCSHDNMMKQINMMQQINFDTFSHIIKFLDIADIVTMASESTDPQSQHFDPGFFSLTQATKQSAGTNKNKDQNPDNQIQADDTHACSSRHPGKTPAT